MLLAEVLDVGFVLLLGDVPEPVDDVCHVVAIQNHPSWTVRKGEIGRDRGKGQHDCVRPDETSAADPSGVVFHALPQAC